MNTNDLNPKILGQLLLMQSIVINLPDLKSIFSFVCKGLKDIPGLNDVKINSKKSDNKQDTDSWLYFSISQNNNDYGDLAIELSNKNAFLPYFDYVKNFVFMLGVILEERKLRDLNELYQEKLEQRIKARTLELKLEKENLMESQRRFNDLMSSIKLLSVMLDSNGNIIFCNNFLLHITGYTYEEIIYKNWFEIFLKAKNKEENQSLFNETIQGKPLIANYESEILTKNGEILLISWNNTLLRNPQNEIIGTASIGEDITQKKQNELIIQNKNDELRQTNDELRKAKEKAEEANLLKTEFLRNMSHEIRTPMNGIMGFSNMMDSQTISTEKRKYYSKIIQNCSLQLLKIIDDILEISTLETKKTALYEESFCLNDFLTELFLVFNLKSKEKNVPIYLHKKWNDNKSHIITDKTKLHKILSNLIENAIRYTNDGFIEISYRKYQDNLIFSIKDTGIGISPESKQVIFERFSQEDKELSRKHGGLGLGLSIAKENAQLLGGNIELESEKDKGSTFFLTIPYKPANSSISSSPKSEKRKATATFTILVAEDEEMNYLYLETLFETEKNVEYKLIHAKNGKEAVDICMSNENIDLVLIDIKMPIMNGLEAAARIKSKFPNLPIIAQTAYSSASDKKLSQEYGCDDFISKPLQPEDLFDLIHKHLNINTKPSSSS